MKRILQISLITTILVLSAIKTNAAVLTGNEVRHMISAQVEKNHQQYTDAELKAEVVALPFKDLEVPNGNISMTVQSSADKFLARDLAKVYVYVNGNMVKSFNAPIVVKAYKNVLVSTGFINRENAITPSNVTIKKIEVSNTIQYPLEATALGKDILAKKAFRDGEIIDKRFVKLRPDVLRNSTVTVVFNTNNLSISIEAIALSDGVIGDNICTMNKNYNKVYTGKVIGENKVLVKI